MVSADKEVVEDLVRDDLAADFDADETDVNASEEDDFDDVDDDVD